MKRFRNIVSILGFILSTGCFAQSSGSYDSDSTYYDTWLGEWYRYEDGKLSDKPTFVVRRGLYHSSFEEYWMGAGGDFSMAWRAWDTRSKNWDFAWMSSDGLFQIWNGKKIGTTWYMYKTFLIDNKEVLSRQAFIPKGDTEIVRTSEHSTDNGSSWVPRFRETYRRRR